MISQLYKFFAAAPQYMQREANAGRYHRVIVAAACSIGVILSVVGTCGLFWHGFPDGQSPKLLLAPVLFFVMGCFAGVSFTCTLAPRAFFQGSGGRRWMQLIGTESIPGARLVCGCLSMVFFAFFAMLAWGAWSDLQS